MSESDLKRTPYAFIPRRLEIDSRPDLNQFPFNIMFMSFANIDGVDSSGTAIYDPSVESYVITPESETMRYHNQFGVQDFIDIQYDPSTGKYEGNKYIDGKHIQIAHGSDWKGFFIHLTMSGLQQGEACKFEPMKFDPPK